MDLNFAFVECAVEVLHQDKSTLNAFNLNWYFAKHNSAVLLLVCIQSKILNGLTFMFRHRVYLGL